MATDDLGDLWYRLRLAAWKLAARGYHHQMGALTEEGISRCESCGVVLSIRHPADFDMPGVAAGPAWRPCVTTAVPTLRDVTPGRLAYMNEQHGLRAVR